MTKELRRLSILMLLMFLALFASTSVIQVVQAENLADNPYNRRTLLDSFEIQRGSLVAGGTIIANSVPVRDDYRYQRVYADAEMWAPITGYTNPVLQSSTSLEKALNKELSGTSSGGFFTRLERLISGQPAQGSNVLLSLDPKIQKAAYDALGSYKGSIVVSQPKTGRILAMVSKPSFDTNLIASHDSAKALEDYSALEKDPNKPLVNRAIGGDLYPPGSTFKILVAAAALESGEYTVDSKLPNPKEYRLPGSTAVVRNAWNDTCGPGEETTLSEAIIRSCNVPFAELAVKLGNEKIRATAEKFGYNHEFSIPLAVTPSTYPQLTESSQVGLTGFGQGKVTSTPLEVAMTTAGIANGGVVMEPRLVDRVVASDLSVEQNFENVEFARALSEESAKAITEQMRKGVQNGAATGARIDGIDVAGKTGTAENGPGAPYTLWFTGFAPADDPEIAIAVVIEDGGGRGQSGSGNSIAAPVAKKVMEAVLGK